MGLSSVDIRDYQSIASGRVALGRLTVVTGPTGSGKSAVIRALRLLAFNSRGTDYIRQGQSSRRVLVVAEDEAVAAAIVRGAGRPRLLRAGRWRPAEEIHRARRRRARQDCRGAAPDRAELTNVSIVLNAAAEAGCKRKEIARDLPTAQKRLDNLREQAGEYAGLRAWRAAIREAEPTLEQARHTAARLARLRVLAAREVEPLGLIVEIPDMGAFQKFMQSDATADAMKDDGVRPATLLILQKASDRM